MRHGFGNARGNRNGGIGGGLKLEGNCVLLFGKSLTGKTARMLHEIRDEARVILVDPKCAQLARLPKFKHVWCEYDEKGRRFVGHPVTDALRPVLNGSFRLCFHFRHHHQECLDLLCRVVLAVKDCVLAVDELGLFVPPGSAGTLPPNITAVAISGTHEGLRFIGTAQRPSLVHRTIKANNSRLLIYRTTDGYDVEAIMRWLPRGWTEDQVMTLPDYVCIDYVDGHDPFIDSSLAGKLKTLPGPRFKRTNTLENPGQKAPPENVSNEK